MPDPATLLSPTPSARAALRAWDTLRPGSPSPQSVEVLKDTGKAAVLRLRGVGPGGAAVIAKRCRRPTALVERTVYERALPRLPVPTLRYHGFAEEDGESAWLFMEDAAGAPYLPGRPAHRAAAARWLAALHTAPLPADLETGLPDQGPACYREHVDGARGRLVGALDAPALGGDDRALLRQLVACCDALAGAWGRLERLCRRWPRTLVHGDFVPKNLRVRGEPARVVVLPFDWEVAGWGPPAADLAECPDLPAYREAVRPSWPDLGEDDLRRLTRCGRIFRLLAAVNWASWRLAYDCNVGRCLGSLRCYAVELAALLQAPEGD